MKSPTFPNIALLLMLVIASSGFKNTPIGVKKRLIGGSKKTTKSTNMNKVSKASRKQKSMIQYRSKQKFSINPTTNQFLFLRLLIFRPDRLQGATDMDVSNISVICHIFVEIWIVLWNSSIDFLYFQRRIYIYGRIAVSKCITS